MIGYILLIGLLLLSKNIKNKHYQLIYMFVVISIFSGLRYGIGYDYYSYLECCTRGSYRGERFELIPQYLVQLSQSTFPYLFFILTSIFISFFYYKGIRQSGSDYYFETFFYLCFPLLFYDQLGIIRQGVASSIVFYAISLNIGDNYNKRTIIRQIVLIILAFFCHRSALIALLILFPWHKVPRLYLFAMFLVSFYAGIILTPLVEAIASTGIVDFSDTERALDALLEEQAGSEHMRQYMIYLIAMASLLLYNKIVKIDKKYTYYIAIVVIGASMYALFSANSSLAKRACMLFFSTSIFVVPQMFKIYTKSRYLYLSVFIALFSFQIYLGSNNRRIQDSSNTSVSYPYRTFIERL